MNRKAVSIAKAGGELLAILIQVTVLLIGCYSVVGAYLSLLLLEVDWNVMAPAIGCLCMLLSLIYRGKPSPRTRIYTLVLLCCYAGVLFLFRQRLAEGLPSALQGLLGHLNQIYQIHIPLLDASQIVQRNIYPELFLAIFPVVLLAGYGIRRRRSPVFGSIVVLALVLACILQVFPGNWYLFGMLLAFSHCIPGAAFREYPAAGRKAALYSMAFAGAAFVIAQQVIQPKLDMLYEQRIEERRAFYRMVNGEWLPRLEEGFNWKALFRNSTVGGELEQDGVYYTQARLYRITMEEEPREVLYLKGYVGDVYTGTDWTALGDEALEQYYAEQGWSIPDDYGEMVNWSWELARAQHLARNQEQDALDIPQITIEEIGGYNRYSLYPYGARLTEGVVHADGSQERRDKVCTYDYQSFREYDGRMPVEETGTAQERARYRQYVYDTYLEVPVEDLEQLSAWVREQRFPEYNGSNLWQVTSQTLRALEAMATYHLANQEVLEGEDYVEAFLFRRQEGYCAHFASAEILILRLLGVPARYAAGYCASPRDFTLEDGVYTTEVLDKQGHAWVEIYVDDFGWMPLEATPGDVAIAYDNRFETVSRVTQMAGDSNIPPVRDTERDDFSEGSDPFEEADSQDGTELSESREEESASPLPGEEPEGEDGALDGDEPEGAGSEDGEPGDDGTEDGEGRDGESDDGGRDGAGEGEHPGGARQDGLGSNGEQDDGSFYDGIPGILGRILFVAFLTGLLLLLRYVLCMRRQKRIRQGHGRGHILYLYVLFRRTLSLAGMGFEKHLLEQVGAAALSGRITASLPDLQVEEVESFLLLVERCSFGPGVPTRQQTKDSIHLLEQTRTQAILKATWYRRVLLWLMG